VNTNGRFPYRIGDNMSSGQKAWAEDIEDARFNDIVKHLKSLHIVTIATELDKLNAEVYLILNDSNLALTTKNFYRLNRIKEISDGLISKQI
jgi:hypothetical protein